MNRIKEIEIRMAAILALLDSNDDVNVTELNTEVDALNEERSKIEARQATAAKINTGTIVTRTIEQPKGVVNVDVRNLKWDAALETEEYRSAWAKDMMGQTLEEEERSFIDKVNQEYRAFTHDTDNTAILIPKTVADGIWKRAEEQSSLWTDVRKLRVRGELTLLGSDNTGDDARWYTEDDEVDTDKLGFADLNLTGCELAKAIQVTWKLRKMALPEFESYIQTEIGERMGKSLGHAVYSGKGKPGVGDTFKPEPLGIKTALSAESGTPQVKEYADGKITYEDLTGVMGGLHSAYANGTTIYANNSTIWNKLANILDARDIPLFIADVKTGGVGRIFGLTVKSDAGIPDNEILVGNLGAGYVANINEDVTMHRDEQMKKRLTDYMGYAIVDGAPRDNLAFTILVPTP